MFGRKINRNKSMEENIKGSSLVPPDCDTCVSCVRTCVKRSRLGVASRRCASMCTRGKTTAGQGQKLTHPRPTSVLQQERYVPKGMMGRAGHTGAAEELHERKRKGGVHRGFRHPKSKQRDANLQRKKETRRGREREEKREIDRRKGILHSSCLGNLMFDQIDCETAAARVN